MNRPLSTFALCYALAGLLTPLCTPVHAAEEAFQPMFNGRDLSGWRHVNTDESTWTVQDDLLICTGKPIGELRTERMYQNFVLELEWRHMVPGGNAGVFVWADDITAPGVPFHRGIEVQVLENAYGNNQSHTTHGDIFPIHGATMEPINGRGGKRAFPTEHRSRPSPQWNHYRIECNDGDISLAVNGKVVTRGRNCNPKKGYICLESEGGVVHYRNVRIRVLPDTPIADDEVAIAERGYRCLYRGIDLDGWTTGSSAAWQPNDWILAFRPDENLAAGDKTLRTEASFGDYGFIVDIRRTDQSGTTKIYPRGPEGPAIATDAEAIRSQLSDPGRWNRLEGTLRGDRLTLTVNGTTVLEDHRLEGLPAEGPLAILPDGPTDLANIYVRE